MRRLVVAASLVCALFAAGTPVSAQELPEEIIVDEDTGETTSTTPSREEAPDTDSCPYSLVPSPPVSTSEELTPGQTTPTPAPIPETPAGGPMLADCGVIIPEGYDLTEEQTASAWMVFDLDSREIIAAKDPHGRYRPASIIKVLLALATIEELDLDATVTATREDADIVGSKVGIGEGGEYTIRDLLYGLLLASGNDAAHLLASQLGGDEETLEKINTLAQDLGAQGTVAASYSGLDAPGMSTTAYDMALLYQHAWTNPVFAEIVDTDHVEFPGWGEHEGFQVWNDNGLLLNDEDGIGGKTGFTDDANHTFVGALDRDGRRLAAVVLDTTVDRGSPWEQAQRLIDAAYAVDPRNGVGWLEEPSDGEGDSVASEIPQPEASSPTESSDVPANRVIIPITVIALLLMTALIWTIRRRSS